MVLPPDLRRRRHRLDRLRSGPYLLTHGTTSLTLVPAADHARLLATPPIRAEEALRAADEAALRDFVIGRLPAAIAQAWTRLFDWVTEVNAKMRPPRHRRRRRHCARVSA